MIRKTQSEEPNLNPLSWMVTFSDLVNLLLTFFVLLVAMSSLDVRVLKQAAGAFGLTGDAMPKNETPAKPQDVPIASRLIDQALELPPDTGQDLSRLKQALTQFNDVAFEQLMNMVDKDVTVERDERGLIIRMSDYILFNEGAADLKPEFLPILGRVAEALRHARYPISIEGHTDESPLEGGTRTWAWNLSLNRAMALLDYFTLDEGLLAERFRVGGYGPSRPVLPGINEENRIKNRRIEIILYKETP